VTADFCDPLRGPQHSSRYWTTVNAAEALPGVPTPLNWSWYDTATENAQVKAKVLVGVSRAGATPSDDRDERHLGIFYGRCALNVDVWRSFADAVPGTSGTSLERDFLGSVRPGRPTRAQLGRYPVVAVKAPLAFRWARRKLTVEAAAHRRWWRDAVASAAVADERQARSGFAAALANFEEHVGLAHLVATMAANGLYDALARVCDKAGHPGLERSLTTAMETEESRMLTALWALRSTDANSTAFLEEFGYQGPAAGELAKSSWRDDPRLLATVIDRYRLLPPDQDPAARGERQRAEAKRARDVLMAALPRAARHPTEALLRLVYAYLPLRESGRGAVLRTIDGSRAAAKVVGAHAAADGRMHQPDDVFMLTVPEMVGAAAQPSADELAFRRRRWEHYQTMRIPPVWTGVPEASPIVAAPDEEMMTLRGIGVGGGIVEGVARVVTDPADDDQLEPGEVLVCHTTDPSWASLFLYAAAVVIDIGSALSHGAIVARELGVPCVINAGDGSRRLRSGDFVRVNGDTGTVERLRAGATEGGLQRGDP
jgi:phosphohistidine swiveling domain-containing protein